MEGPSKEPVPGQYMQFFCVCFVTILFRLNRFQTYSLFSRTIQYTFVYGFEHCHNDGL